MDAKEPRSRAHNGRNANGIKPARSVHKLFSLKDALVKQMLEQLLQKLLKCKR
jgi:hypothetical protein